MAIQRQHGAEHPYWPLGPFKLRLPFIHYRWEFPEMVQGLFMFVVSLGMIPLLMKYLGMPYEAALAFCVVAGIGYLLPALFGSMALGLFASSSSGSKMVKGGIKGVLPVLVIMTVLSLAARLAGHGSVLGGLVGIFIIVMLPIGILTSYVLWKKGRIQVVDKEQK